MPETKLETKTTTDPTELQRLINEGWKFANVWTLTRPAPVAKTRGEEIAERMVGTSGGRWVGSADGTKTIGGVAIATDIAAKCLRQFIASAIDAEIAAERERIVGIIEMHREALANDGLATAASCCKTLISLIRQSESQAT